MKVNSSDLINMMDESRKRSYETGYNKAIDDFSKKLLETAPKNYAGTFELGGRCNYLSARHVMDIAEQLKI